MSDALSEEETNLLLEKLGGVKYARNISSGGALVQVTNLVLEIPKDIDIEAFMDKSDESRGLRVVESDSDTRLKSLTEIDFTKIKMGSCMRKDDPMGSVTGLVKLERLKSAPLIRLGFETLYSVIQNEAGGTVLEWLYEAHGIRFIDFFGTIFENPKGERFILFLFRHNDGEWIYDKRSLKHVWPDGTIVIPI